MRRRLVAVALATTSLVALAFAIPLGLLVREVARDRALSAAERDLTALAPVLAVTTDPDVVTAAIGRTPTGAAGRLSVWAGTAPVGDPAPVDPELALAREQRLAFSAATPGGISIYQPVVTDDGSVAVVRARVTDDQLDHGLPVAWGPWPRWRWSWWRGQWLSPTGSGAPSPARPENWPWWPVASATGNSTPGPLTAVTGPPRLPTWLQP